MLPYQSKGDERMDSMYEQNIVIDLEFTRPTDEEVKASLPFEIIQIGAVRVDARGNSLDTFESYVRPWFARDISREVKRLTGISRDDVFAADPLEHVMTRFLEWVGKASTRVVAWSDSDFIQLSRETRFKGMPFALGSLSWLDLQKVCPRLMGVNVKGYAMGLSTAAEWCDIEISPDRLHGALYDATVTAKLLARVMASERTPRKKALPRIVCAPDKREVLTANIGSRFAELLDLKASLLAASSAR